MSRTSLTGILDYGVGNVRSVQSAISKVGGTPILSSDHEELLACDRLILPGVGAFAHAVAELKARGLDDVLNQSNEAGKPLLGICLGMQMLTKESLEFGATPGLAFTSGNVTELRANDGKPPVRLPHVAWKSLRRVSSAHDWLFEGVAPDAKFYFIHSFAAQGDSDDIVAYADHEGIQFAAVIGRGNVVGTQFHPEKSGTEGLKILQNFVSKGL